MNIGLETLTELVSMIWNADVNNGAGIVLCDSSKLKKSQILMKKKKYMQL